MNIRKKIIALSMLTTLGMAAATDGTMDSSESVGSISIRIDIDPEILITGLDDLVFTTIGSHGALLAAYEEEVGTNFCVYTNAPEFTLTVEPQYGTSGLKNQDYTQVSPLAPKDNIPLTYSLMRNQISEGSISGSPIIIGSTFQGDETTAPLVPLVDIMNSTCTSIDSGTSLTNYILRAKISGANIKQAASGNYFSNVTLRATIPQVLPQ
jgi:hypothetical protein